MSGDWSGDPTDEVRILGADQAGAVPPASQDDDPFAQWFEADVASTGVRPVVPAERSGVDRPAPPAASSSDGFTLPDWTAPATGQVPKVIVGDRDPDQPTGTGPVYRTERAFGHDTDTFEDLADQSARLGALDHNRPSAFDDFDDDLDAPMAPRRSAVRPPTRSGGAETGDFRTDSFGERDFDDPGLTGSFDAPTLRGAGGPGSGPAGDDRPVRRIGGRGGDEDTGRVSPTTRTPTHEGGVGRDRDLGQAAGVGIALIAAAFACFKLGPISTLALVFVVLMLAAMEFFTALRRGGYHPAPLVGLAGTAGLLLGTYFAQYMAYPIVIGLTVMTALFWFVWVTPGDRALTNLSVTVMGVLYVGGLGSFATLALGVGQAQGLKNNNGIGVIIGAAVAAVAYDVGAYFVGSMIGQTPLGPAFRAASPNKTQEGLMGGFICSVLATFALMLFGKLAPIGADGLNTRVALFSLLCAAAAPAGDLCESMIKRDLGVKDMGNVLPGHGGVLDRFDALLFVLPAAFLVWHFTLAP